MSSTTCRRTPRLVVAFILLSSTSHTRVAAAMDHVNEAEILRPAAIALLCRARLRSWIAHHGVSGTLRLAVTERRWGIDHLHDIYLDSRDNVHHYIRSRAGRTEWHHPGHPAEIEVHSEQASKAVAALSASNGLSEIPGIVRELVPDMGTVSLERAGPGVVASVERRDPWACDRFGAPYRQTLTLFGQNASPTGGQFQGGPDGGRLLATLQDTLERHPRLVHRWLGPTWYSAAIRRHNDGGLLFARQEVVEDHALPRNMEEAYDAPVTPVADDRVYFDPQGHAVLRTRAFSTGDADLSRTPLWEVGISTREAPSGCVRTHRVTDDTSPPRQVKRDFPARRKSVLSYLGALDHVLKPLVDLADTLVPYDMAVARTASGRWSSGVFSLERRPFGSVVTLEHGNGTAWLVLGVDGLPIPNIASSSGKTSAFVAPLAAPTHFMLGQ